MGKLNFQAVIKSAASAASRKPKSREGSSRGAPDGGSAGGRRPRGAPLELPLLDLGFLEAALAADLITARECASYIKVTSRYLFVFVSNIWPLVWPNIAKRRPLLFKSE